MIQSNFAVSKSKANFTSTSLQDFGSAVCSCGDCCLIWRAPGGSGLRGPSPQSLKKLQGNTAVSGSCPIEAFFGYKTQRIPISQVPEESVDVENCELSLAKAQQPIFGPQQDIRKTNADALGNGLTLVTLGVLRNYWYCRSCCFVPCD